MGRCPACTLLSPAVETSPIGAAPGRLQACQPTTASPSRTKLPKLPPRTARSLGLPWAASGHFRPHLASRPPLGHTSALRSACGLHQGPDPPGTCPPVIRHGGAPRPPTPLPSWAWSTHCAIAAATKSTNGPGILARGWSTGTTANLASSWPQPSNFNTRTRSSSSIHRRQPPPSPRCSLAHPDTRFPKPTKASPCRNSIPSMHERPP